MRKRNSRPGFLLVTIPLLAAAFPARASVMSATPDAPLSAIPFLVSLGGGAAGYDFTEADTGDGPGAAVATTGTAQVSNFLGLTDFEAGSSIDGSELFTFTPFPTATLIPNSAADDFIGLAFMLSDGTHYGYAEVDGAELVSYGYETTPDTTILTGAVAVPEPAEWPVLASAFIGWLLILRRGFSLRGLLNPLRQIGGVSRNT